MHNESGASAIEYALLAAFIAVFVIGTVVLLGGTVGELYCSIAQSLPFGPEAECG